jgi:hypothetical protein
MLADLVDPIGQPAQLACTTGADGVARLIGKVLDAVGELERAEAARELAAHESRTALTGVRAGLWRANGLIHELAGGLRDGTGGNGRAPLTLESVRETMAAVTAGLSDCLTTPVAQPAMASEAPAYAFNEVMELVERLRAEVETAHQATVPAVRHVAALEVAAALRTLASELADERSETVRQLEQQLGSERAKRILAEAALATERALSLADDASPTARHVPAQAEVRGPAATPSPGLELGPILREPSEIEPDPAAPRQRPVRLSLARRPTPVDDATDRHEPAPAVELAPAIETTSDAVSTRPRPNRGPRRTWTPARGGGSWLARALHRLAYQDPDAAVDLALTLLPGRGWRTREPLVFTIAVREVGAFRIMVERGETRVDEYASSVPDDAGGEFHIDASLEEFTDIACGAVRRRGAGLTVTGNRRQLTRLLRGDRPSLLADAAELGLDVEPDLALLAVIVGIRPEWTVGYSFTIAFDLPGAHGGSWLVTVADGQRVRVASAAGDQPVSCRITVPEDCFLRYVCDRAQPWDATPVVEGNKHAAVMLRRWMNRSQGQPDTRGPRRLQAEGRAAA